MSVAAGERNRLITIEKKVPGKDAVNQPIDVWTTHRKRWARPLGNTGMAAIRGAEQGVAVSPGKYSWRCNFHLDSTDAMRVVYKGTIYDIKEIRHDLQNREWTDLVCETGASRG